MSFDLRENMYGHLKRLKWIASQISPDDIAIELGCGTGYMIARPLSHQGYTIYGVDLDEQSINYGRQVFIEEGLDPAKLQAININQFKIQPSIVIASEVLEHLENSELTEILMCLKHLLKSDGRLLVTVPNGYGWFELESWLWFGCGLGQILENLKIKPRIQRLKHKMLHFTTVEKHPSTLAHSPHKQRFTFSSIQQVLRHAGFSITSTTGSVLFAGPLSNLFFAGFEPLMTLNCKLGQMFPSIASGFYISCLLDNEQKL